MKIIQHPCMRPGPLELSEMGHTVADAAAQRIVDSLNGVSIPIAIAACMKAAAIIIVEVVGRDSERMAGAKAEAAARFEEAMIKEMGGV